jgi:hypothetical protein
MELNPTEQITYLIVPDDSSNDGEAVQMVISRAEAHAMLLMPGGLCLGNWLRLRGLTPDPVAES